MNTKLEKVKKALLTVSKNTGYLKPIDATTTYLVYQEDSESGSLHANNKKSIQVLQGTIDLYAKTNDVGTADRVQNALDKSGISYRLNSVLYEDANKQMIHYEWVFEVA